MSDTNDPLQALYPFLHGNKKDPVSENTALLESVMQKSRDSLSAKQAFFDHHGQAVVNFARIIAEIYQGNGKMFSMGNGGSSCDAAHFAVEFQHPVTAGRPALPAMNLTMDMPMFSAVANDLGIKHVFSRQIGAHGRSTDGLLGFSTSGNSENLMEGFRRAKELGMTTLGLCGGQGGDMLASGLVDHCLVVESDSIHRIQEVHVACYHIIWDLVHTLLADHRGELGQSSQPSPPTPLPKGEGSNNSTSSSPKREESNNSTSSSPERNDNKSPSPSGRGVGVREPGK